MSLSALQTIEENINTYGQQELKEIEYCLENPDFEFRVPSIREFITSPYYLDRNDVWKVILEDLEEFYNKDKGYKEAVFCEAIGAGKSFKSSVIVCYEVMKFLALKNPQEYFGLAKGSEIDFVNTGTNSTQALRIVFGQIKTKIDESPWFQNFFPPDPNIKSELKFPQKKICIVPGNSTDTFALGMNIYGGIVDEASFYKVTDRKDYAEDLYDSINRRIRSRGNQRFKTYGKMVVISSPLYKGDFIERKMKEARDNPKIFSRRRKLWESAPKENFCGETFKYKKYKVPIEFKDDFDKNPEKSERDLMAIASSTLEPYIKLNKKLQKAIGERINPEEAEMIITDYWCKDNYERYVHIDLALTKDACGFAMGHLEDGNRAVIDLVIRVEARKGEEIQFSDIREYIYLLSTRKFNIKLISYDGWQSVDSRQILQAKGYEAVYLSIDRNMEAYDQYKSFMYQEKLDLPWIEYEELEKRNPQNPAEWLIKESENLECIKAKKVEHPPKGSKDVADAVAGVCFWLGKMASQGQPSAPKSTKGKVVKDRERKKRKQQEEPVKKTVTKVIHHNTGSIPKSIR